MRTIATALALTLASSVAAIADSQNFTSQMLLTTSSGWVNQSGSVATFQFRPTPNPNVYTLQGTYVNNAPNTGCQGTPYPLTGYYYVGNGTMSWSVAWSNNSNNCQSITGWTGYFNKDTITTNWNLSFKGSGGYAIKQGSDTFTYMTAPVSKKLPH